jgi:polysaccharide biosynthesis/export protein
MRVGPMVDNFGMINRRRFPDWVRLLGAGLGVYFLAAMTLAAAQDANPAAPAATPDGDKPGAIATASAPIRSANVAEYTVSPEDLLDINVMDVPEVSRTYRVSSNGFLTLPLLTQPVLAEGQSLEQLAQLIATRFRDAGMLNNAQVSVSLKETRLHTVLVSGEVKAPQSYPLYGPTRLIDILVKAGGVTPASGDNVIVTRGDAGVRADAAESAQSGTPNLSANGRSFTLNIRKLVDTGDDPGVNILMYPGDRVMVQRAEMIYVLGAVVHPGGYVLSDARQHVTVLKALAMAGDVSNIAKRSKIMVLRKDPSSLSEKRLEITVNYTSMARGKIDDMRLIPDDILFVPESTALKAIHASTTAAVEVAATGGSALLIYH